METFDWCVRANASAQVEHRIRSAKFGDGYAQISSDGLNERGEAWDVSLTVNEDVAREVRRFLDRHKGAQAFTWTPPLGSASLWRCQKYQITALGGKWFTLTANFEQAFAP